LKIIFVNRYFHPDISATSQLLTDLAFELARAREIAVVTSRQRYDDARALLPRDESIRGVDVHRVSTTRFGRGNLLGRAFDYASFYLAAGVALWRLARPGDVVVAKTDPPLISIVAALACSLRRAKLVNWIQDLFPEVAEVLGTRGIHGPFASVLRAFRNRSLKAAALNVVLSRDMEQRILQQGVPGQSVRIVPNWADGARITPIDSDGSQLRSEWKLEGAFVVCYSGNMGRVHEFDSLLEAAKLVQAEEERPRGDPARRHRRTTFVFIGGGAQKKYIESRARELGLSRLAFKPYQPREMLRDSLGAGDVHLVSLRPELEGLVVPSKIYGILAAGRPVVFVGADDGEIAELLRSSGAGFAVRAGNGPHLAETLIRLRDDPLLRDQMGRKARCLFEERFDFRISAAKFGEALALASAPETNV
jgi:glycosyltransferase involved in cell wall biosynthesis